MLQPTDRRLGNATSSNCAIQTSTDLLHLGFDYGASTTNNGNMLQQTIWAPDNGSGSPWQVTQDYTYDQVNRIEKAEEKLGGVLQWSRDYAYDHFGNRWISGNWGHTLHMATPKSQSAIQASTNRLTGAGIVYDNAGNLTAHPHITTGSGSMAYDANNKMKSFTATGVSVTTTYDAAARRVRKVYNSETTVWVYDAFGKLTAEYTTESHTDVATYFRTTDHLGSTRLTTDAIGAVIARRDFFPFGERTDSNLSGRGSVLDRDFHFDHPDACSVVEHAAPAQRFSAFSGTFASFLLCLAATGSVARRFTGSDGALRRHRSDLASRRLVFGCSEPRRVSLPAQAAPPTSPASRRTAGG